MNDGKGGREGGAERETKREGGNKERRLNLPSGFFVCGIEKDHGHRCPKNKRENREKKRE